MANWMSLCRGSLRVLSRTSACRRIGQRVWLKAFAAALLLCGSALPAGEPGERSVGPATKSGDFLLVWGKLKANSEVDFSDDAKSKYYLALQGSVEAPPKLDVVALWKQVMIVSMTDDANHPVQTKPMRVFGDRHNAIHFGVGQVELPRTQLPIDATRIRAITFGTQVVVAEERTTTEIPAAVMEDFKPIGSDIEVRITSLRMSTGRELTVQLNFRRAGKGISGAFIERIFALDPRGEVLGGGRWTDGDPLGAKGTWTAKFKLAGDQVHQSFRVDIVTKSSTHKVAFDVEGIFKRQAPPTK